MQVCETLHRALMDWTEAALPGVTVFPGFPDPHWIKNPTVPQAAVVFVRSQTGLQFFIQTSQPFKIDEIQTGEGNLTKTYYNLGRAPFQCHILLLSKGEGANQKIDDMHGRLLLYLSQHRKFGTDDDYMVEDIKVTLIRPELDPATQKRLFRRDVTLIISGSIIVEEEEHVVEDIELTTGVGEDVEP